MNIAPVVTTILIDESMSIGVVYGPLPIHPMPAPTGAVVPGAPTNAHAELVPTTGAVVPGPPTNAHAELVPTTGAVVPGAPTNAHAELVIELAPFVPPVASFVVTTIPIAPITISPAPCVPYTIGVYPWDTLPNLDTDPEYWLFYNNPVDDGVSFNVNLGGYAPSWQGPDALVRFFEDAYPNEASPFNVNGPAIYTTSKSPELDYLEFEPGSNFYEISDPTVVATYRALDPGLGPVGTPHLTPGYHEFPGIASGNAHGSTIARAVNYGYPVLYEVWYGLNVNRTNPLKGFNNYTFFGSSTQLPSVELPTSGHVKKYYAGVFKANADLTNPQLSDMVVATWYEGDAHGGVVKIAINGAIIRTGIATAGATSIGGWLTTRFAGSASHLGTHKSNCEYISISTGSVDIEFAGIGLFNQTNSNPVLTDGMFDTHQVKFGVYVDTNTGQAPGTPLSVQDGYSIRIPGVNFSALPNTSLLCTPTTVQPTYKPTSLPLPIQQYPWAATYGARGVNTDFWFEGSTTDSTGNIVAVGAQATPDNCVLVTKWDPVGNLLWQKGIGDSSYPSIWGELVTTDSSNNIYVFSSVDNAASIEDSPTCIGFYKFDPSGNLLFQKEFELVVPTSPTGYFIEQSQIGSVCDTGNGIVVSLDSSNGYGDSGVYISSIVKFDYSGQVMWFKTEVPSEYSPYTALEHSDQFVSYNAANTALILSHSARYSVSNPTTGYQVQAYANVISTYASTNQQAVDGAYAAIVWSSTIRSNVPSNASKAVSIVGSGMTDEGNVYAVGKMFSGELGILKLSSTGALLWVKSYNTGCLVPVIRTNGNNVYISYNFNSRVRVIKINGLTDQVLWTVELTSSDNSFKTYHYNTNSHSLSVTDDWIVVSGYNGVRDNASAVLFNIPTTIETLITANPMPQTLLTSNNFTVVAVSTPTATTITSDYYRWANGPTSHQMSYKSGTTNWPVNTLSFPTSTTNL